MSLISLSNHLDTLERNGVLSTAANKSIKQFLDYSNRSTGKLFLVICGMMGALFVSAGVFSLIAHNWDNFNDYVKGTLSVSPSLIALWFYYIALFKHPKSVVWIEVSSLFLMLMIGASIWLVSQTYHLDGDMIKFITVWLILTLPLFYIARASGIAVIYLVLTCFFLDVRWYWFIPSASESEHYYRYWIFLFGYLPHFFMILDFRSRKQGFRAIYLAWVTGIMLFLSLGFAIKAGHLWWYVGLLMSFYLLSKRFFGENISSLGRPLQTITLLVLFFAPLALTMDYNLYNLFEDEGHRKLMEFADEEYLFYIAGLLFTVGMATLGIIQALKRPGLNFYVISWPLLLALLFILYFFKAYVYTDWDWIMTLALFILNFYILAFGVNAMIQGNRSKNILYMIYGLLLVSNLLWTRYDDLDISFWLKGLIFIGVGGLFFLINYLSTDEYEEEQ